MAEPARCLECHGVEPDECVDCMGTGHDLTDVEWQELHDEFMSRLVRHITASPLVNELHTGGGHG